MNMRSLFLYLFSLFMLLGSEILDAQMADISVRVEWENEPFFSSDDIEGVIIVTHPTREKIDPHGFFFEGKPFEVEKTQEISLPRANASMPWQMTLFSFSLPPFREGLHLLSSITLRHQGEEYATPRMGFQVVYGEKEERSATPLPAPILFLEAEYEGPKPLFPGLRGYLVYRIYFNRNIVLTEEDLPLLTPKGLRKVGNVEIRELEKGGISVQQIRQQVEAERPGTYTWGPSHLVGLVEGTEEQLVAKASSPSVVVVAFPPKKSLIGFAGAVGDFSFFVEPVSTTEVEVGGSIELRATIAGEGNISDVTFPALGCQPGFSGLFGMETKPVVVDAGEQKEFTITLRPLAPFLREIPPMTFTYFSPEEEKYVSLIHPAVPIVVKKPPVQPILVSPRVEKTVPQDTLAATLAPLPEKEWLTLFSPFWETSSVFFLIPFGVVVLYLQGLFRQAWKKRAKKSRSEELFAQAWRHKGDESFFFGYFAKALEVYYEEQREIRAKEYLAKLQKKRYGEGKTLSPRKVWKQWWRK